MCRAVCWLYSIWSNNGTVSNIHACICNVTMMAVFYVLLTVLPSRYNSCKWPTWRTVVFSICLFQFSTCFEQPRAHHWENQLYQYNIWYVSLWPSSMQVGKFLPDMHTRRSPAQSDTYQILYWYNWFSWWWARSCSKHVENWSKHTEKGILRQVGLLQELGLLYIKTYLGSVESQRSPSLYDCIYKFLCYLQTILKLYSTKFFLFHRVFLKIMSWRQFRPTVTSTVSTTLRHCALSWAG
jgi:hypothetical protein